MPERPVNILMADDSPTDCELARMAFKNGRILNRLAFVHNGEEVLEYLRKQGRFENATRPDVILLDLNMPIKDGREVLAELKQDPELRKIPVIIVTTSEDEADILTSYDLQASSYITKPVGFANFLEIAKSIKHFYFNIVTLPPNGDK
jgi:CheY-like chemotaxis protein